MKMIFRGFRHSIFSLVHEHEVFPFGEELNTEDKFFYRVRPEDPPMIWQNSSLSLGQIRNVKLTGNYMVEFHFKQEDLEAWFHEFVDNSPMEALQFISEMQTRACERLEDEIRTLKESINKSK